LHLDLHDDFREILQRKSGKSRILHSILLKKMILRKTHLHVLQEVWCLLDEDDLEVQVPSESFLGSLSVLHALGFHWQEEEPPRETSLQEPSLFY
jgi:hypothetical protein